MEHKGPQRQIQKLSTEVIDCRHSPLGFELLHNVKEIIVHLGLAAKLQFHLIKIRKCILHLRTRTKIY